MISAASNALFALFRLIWSYNQSQSHMTRLWSDETRRDSRKGPIRSSDQNPIRWLVLLLLISQKELVAGRDFFISQDLWSTKNGG